MATSNNFDAIVVGSGMSGGWAAKELCEKGLKTLVLERGFNLRHITDYTTALKDPWQLPHNNRATNADRAAQQRKRRRSEVQDREKEDLDARQNGSRVGIKFHVRFVRKPEYESVSAQQPRPKQQ